MTASAQPEHVPAAGWSQRARDLHDQGYAVFDALIVWPTNGTFTARLQVRQPAGEAHGIQTEVAEGEALPSLTPVYPGAAWPEREAAEMLGLRVSGFDDGTGLGVRPLLLPPAETGMPLRPEFQLTARVETPWPGRPTSDRPARGGRP